MDNLTGQRFGRLVVAAQATGSFNRPHWLCHCDCGGTIVARGDNLKSRRNRSCGCMVHDSNARQGLAGRRFGRWKVLEQGPSSPTRIARWWCRCSCNTKALVNGSDLRRGKSRSCGCLVPEALAKSNRTHNHSKRNAKTPEYTAWLGMKQRCYYTKHRAYAYYGGRGIRVCKRWLHSFEKFLADVGPRPSSRHSLDRYPNQNGNYQPSNVRWATKKQQQNNMRSNR